jgi:hypothetical protein
MMQAPDVMLRTPEVHCRLMDVLSDLLRGVRLKGGIIHHFRVVRNQLSKIGLNVA